jgi:BMFP domain-containing protein YqiC
VQRFGVRFLPMIDRRLFDDLGARLEEAVRNSPAQDIGRNVRALLAAWFDRMDLVLREDFEVQRTLLERAQARLVELEARVAELESRTSGKRPQ